MKGTFDFVPQIKAKVGEYGVKKNLSPEELQELSDLKQQKAELQKQIRALDPSSDATGKRVARRNAAMEQLMNLSMMNKELKSVGWMNSKEAVEEQFNKDRLKDEDKQQYKGWAVDASRDISGDGIPDVIIYDESGAVRGVNGNTIRKSKYPERQLYTKQYPSSQQRRATKDRMTGKPVNYDVDINGNKIPGSERYVSKGKYLDDTLYHIEYDHNTGNAEYSHEYTKNTKKLTPFKLFNKYVMSNYWAALGEHGYLKEIPKHLKSMFYIRLKTNAWDFIKNWAATKILGVNYPENKEARNEFDKTAQMKNALAQLMKEIIATELGRTFNELEVVLNTTREQIMEIPAGRLAMEGYEQI